MKLGKKISVILMLILSLCMVCGIFAACEDENKVEPLTFNSFSSATAQVYVGQETTLSVKSNRKPVEGEVIEWKSDKESVATVNNGKVKGIAEGEATITATYGENTATCKVTVSLKKEITLDQESVLIYVGGKSKTLIPTCKKGEEVVTDATVIWTSSDETVVTVKDGVLTAVDSEESVRTAVVTAEYDGAKASCEVRVINDATDYVLGRGNANADVIKKPGTWFYFDKNSNGLSTYTGTDCQRTHDEDGEILTCKFEKIEMGEGKTPEQQELYLRYMPDLAKGTQYKVSFSFVSNTAGSLEIGDYKATFDANETIDFYAIQTVGDYPLNVKFFVLGEGIEFVLTKVTVTTDFSPEEVQTPAE